MSGNFLIFYYKSLSWTALNKLIKLLWNEKLLTKGSELMFPTGRHDSFSVKPQWNRSLWIICSSHSIYSGKKTCWIPKKKHPKIGGFPTIFFPFPQGKGRHLRCRFLSDRPAPEFKAWLSWIFDPNSLVIVGVLGKEMAGLTVDGSEIPFPTTWDGAKTL